ncbi:MAG TPA: cupin domain-containing protein [Candidatus Aquilonibacter sp.]|nr:cupin domain-containing protein [Candidatus Aquilonibacter sp.]
MSAQEEHGAHVSLARALSSNPAAGNLAAEMMRRGSVDLEFYSPHLVDLQQPHERDELYVVARGTGVLEVDAERFRFKTGDVLFVPAYAEHRFVEFSDDFGTWVLFYGPPGGEAH